MSDVKLASALPEGSANGLGALVSSLINNPQDMRVVIALVDCKSITTNADTAEVVPTARIRRIEAILDEDLPEAHRLFSHALEDRTGRVMLPLGLDDEVRSAFQRDQRGGDS